MSIHQLINGPQTIGVLLIIAGVIQKLFPPKDINGMYGFRTDTSRQNRQTFDEGNRYSAALSIKLGIVFLLIGLALMLFIDRKHAYIMPILTLAAAVSLPILLIRRTDKHLEEMFDKDDE